MSESLTGEDDKISFALSHGAYYVVTNQGGFTLTGGERLYRSSANGAQFGRKTAQRIYGYEMCIRDRLLIMAFHHMKLLPEPLREHMV